ncbi:aldo/keto reductase [Nocardia crassostreae]|uniref:aldo/keto reductase n=1 Tax=Nocardia crassostreae TaxID=53428 RepID=UPI001C3F5E69|nr:aldo/keto reductase [Nocardia crassostreae]
MGTWQAKGEDAYRAVRSALDAGYRHIDTARLYGNEEQVGRAIRDSGIDRDSLFLTTKYAQREVGGEFEALTASLRRLGVDRVDLWLMHFPLSDAADNARVWERFLAAATDGAAASVGVSNHSVEQLDALTAATGQRPAVNQIRFNPVLYDAQLIAAHRDRQIVLEGHSPLRCPPLDHPTLVAIAERRAATPAQVVLAWHLAHDIPVIPKSVHPQRIIENYRALELRLTPEDVAEIDALGRGTLAASSRSSGVR